MTTPSEVAEKYPSQGEIDVPELGGTVSWADLERDASCWLGNTMQWAYYTTIRRLEPLVKETEDKTFMKTWRYFQTSDHLYYMFTAGGTPGEVHSYFSPFGTPTDAFVTAQAAILDFENRVRLAAVVADEPFLFYTGVGERHYTGKTAWSLKGLIKTIREASLRSLEFHGNRGDFEKWAEESLRDKRLADQLEKTTLAKLKGEQLRKAIVNILTKRFAELSVQTRASTQSF
jgi:alpha-amylase